jgi:hypothetical protein
MVLSPVERIYVVLAECNKMISVKGLKYRWNG